MEDFVVSARKYRPQTFDDVVGQKNITETLLKAIDNNHLAQAFLFCGPRGVGKTTCARILAKKVNSLNETEVPQDRDFSFNVFELDAASNNTVDDIRNLIDQVRIPPQTGKYKVYIIDEVHMLSASAFNAFLKTLEEPPPYAIFIMATTEKHKVLPTILSRCQIFDFHRITIPDMVAHLKGIARAEGITADENALHVIAEKADGALRDALSIFDQIAGFAGNEITYQDVIENLNILDYDYYFQVVDAIIDGNKTKCILLLHEIIENGFDPHNFVNGLASHMRNLLFCLTEDTASILEVGENVRDKYFKQASNIDSRLLLNGLSTLSETDLNYNQSKNPRLMVELVLLKLCALKDRLEKKKDIRTEPELAQRTKSNGASTTAQILSSEASDLHRQKTPPADTQTQAQKTSQNIDRTPGIEKKQVQESIPEAKTDTELPRAEEEIPSSKNVVEETRQPSNQSVSEDQTPKAKMPGKLSKAKSFGIPSLAQLESELGFDIGSQKKSIEESPDPADSDALDDSRPATDFTLAKLWEAWDAYALNIKEQDKQSYYATLTKHRPVMKEKYKLEFLVDNHVQKSDLDTDKLELLEFLRERLNNGQIRLEVIIDEVEREDGDSLYDPRQKYEAMVKRNPLLADLREKFDLDVDYDA
jgi:DNA polymerase-3 subunit gamma/tau